MGRKARTPAIDAVFPGVSGSLESDVTSRQEGQIVQSLLNLGVFLRAPWKGARS